jgi:hypothetical protein
MTNVPGPEYPPMLVPRDVAYERLIALARDARHNHVRVNPASDLGMDVCRCCLETQPSPHVLAPTLGGHERAQAVVGPAASCWRFAAGHIPPYGSDGVRAS